MTAVHEHAPVWPERHAGRIAVVTGAAAGLGQAYAVRLAAEGARVIAADLNGAEATVEQAARAGGSVMPVECDVTDAGAVDALAGVAREHGGCDILVNNAGISPNVAWSDADFALWRRVLATNLDAMFLTCRALTPAMIERGWGRIVNIASNTMGLVIPGFSAYMASKGGVIGFTRALATDLGPHGITVNAVAPGLTKTATTEAMWDGTTLFEDMAAQQAVKRPGVPDDLVGAVSFLASEEARWVTGQTLSVDGGLWRV